MFLFPKAVKKTCWGGQGQGHLFKDGLLKYFGGGSLGCCFGISCTWIIKKSVFDCVPILRENRNDIDTIQGNLAHYLDVTGSAKDLVETIAMAAFPIEHYKKEVSLQHFPNSGGRRDGPLVDLLKHIDYSRSTKHGVISFWYSHDTTENGKQKAAHAIAFSFSSPDEVLLIDPNYGIGFYSDRTQMCFDLRRLLLDYIVGGNSISEIVLLELENNEAFGDFV